MPAAFHRPASQNAVSAAVLFLLPFLLIVPALVVWVQTRQRILAALLLLPVLAFGIYVAVIAIHSIANRASEGSSSFSSIG